MYTDRSVRSFASCAAACVTLAAMPTAATAQSVEEFYRGKNVNMVIGFSAGGGYDLYGRLVARHIGKHIPGKPTVISQNMTGAGSIRAALYTYSVAPKDGTVIGVFGRSVPTTPLLAPATAQFDGTKFTWLGSVTNDVVTCLTWHDSPVKTWNDVLSKPITMGGEGPGGDPDLFTLLFKNVFDAKMRLVTGYHGTAEITLAMERKEVDGLCGISWSTLKSRYAKWMEEKKINIIIQAALKKEPELAHVPLASDLTQDHEKQQILKLFLASQEVARPFAAPPDIPADRKAALIAAFAATMKDPEFLADAAKQSLDVNPISAAEVDQLLGELYATPKAVLEKAALAVTK
jgi:tripartite-type tricarboxylate transporter receptor subunit TctC